jgi:hypothetical protein
MKEKMEMARDDFVGEKKRGQVDELLKYALTKTIYLLKSEKLESRFCWPIEFAEEKLEEIGFNREQIEILIKPLYQSIIQQLIDKRIDFIENNKLRSEETCYQLKNIVKAYRLFGDKGNFMKWEDGLIISQTIIKLNDVMEKVSFEIKEMEEKGRDEDKRIISSKKHFLWRIKSSRNEMTRARRCLGIK